MENKKLVIYTGSFNPVTLAHVEVMKKSMELLGDCKGLFLPTCDENIKSKMINKMERLSLSGDIRCKMLNCICKSYPNIKVSDYEINTHNSNDTYKTFKHFQNEYKNYDLYYIMGADKLYNLPHFKNIESFLKEFYFVVFDRGDINAGKVIENSSLFNKYQDHFVILDELKGLSDVSSSKIREMFLNNNKEYRKYLSDGVSDILESINLDDYPEVDIYDYINLKLKSGPHGVISAGRKVYLMNKELFNTSLKDVPELEVINNDLNGNSKFKTPTRLSFEDMEYVDLMNNYPNSVTIVECNSRRSGGKYDQGGSDTLEEELCKISNLSLALYKYGDPKLKCVRQSSVNVNNIYPLNNNLYIKDITLIRNGKNNDYRLLNNFNNKMDVIMVPSLNLTKMDKVNDLAYVSDDHLNDEGINLMIKRLRNAFIYADELGKDTIIINAFGSGFHLNLSDAGYILTKVLFEFDGRFKNIVINVPIKGKAKKEYCDYIMGEFIK